MSSEEHLLLAGASVRAAAFSALRAGLRPWCVDLFADADLQARCPARALPAEDYPEGLVQVFAEAPSGPWLYTGALENRPRLVDRLWRLRPNLWGLTPLGLAAAGAAQALAAYLPLRGVPCPGFRPAGSALPKRSRWLVKPLAGAGGRGIAFATKQSRERKGVYFQEYIEGEACAAIYRGGCQESRLLGVTRQLIGEEWLHAAPFHYCGSVGPLDLDARLRAAFEKLGAALVEGFQVSGLFGVDCVVRDGIPFPVEVNPRYTASMEVLEHATGLPLLALHRQVFEAQAPEPVVYTVPGGMTGKGILFAPRALTFPVDGPWTEMLRQPADVWALPAFADIPHAGEQIPAGRPVLTFFARGSSAADCQDRLRRIAAELDRHCFG